MRAMPRANPRCDGMTVTPAPGSGSTARRSAWKEAARGGGRRPPGQTLERKDPVRAAERAECRPFGSSVSAVEVAKAPRCTARRREGTALVAEGDAPRARAGGSGGGSTVGRTAPRGGSRSVRRGLERDHGLRTCGEARTGEPQECCDELGRVHRQAERGERRQRWSNAKGAKSRGWQPGAGTAIGAFGLWGAWPGRFARPESAEGERNPMRGGSALRERRAVGESPSAGPLPGRRAVAGRRVRRVAPAAAGHASKGTVSEESRKNSCAGAHAWALARLIEPNARRAAAIRTNEDRGARGKLWTSTETSRTLRFGSSSGIESELAGRRDLWRGVGLGLPSRRSHV